MIPVSLIQEALRRKDDEDGGGELKPARIIPPITGPIPQPRPPPVPPKSSPLMAALMVLLLTLMVVVIGILLYFGHSIVPKQVTSLTATASNPERAPSAATAGPVESQSLVVVPPASNVMAASDRGQNVAPKEAVQPVAVVKPTPERMPISITTGEVHTARTPAPSLTNPITESAISVAPSNPAPAAPKAAPIESVSVAPVAAPPSPPPVQPAAQPPPAPSGLSSVIAALMPPPAAPEPPASQWPRLKVVGVIGRGGRGDGTAIINGTMFEVNEQVQGARVVEVSSTGVVFELKGQTQFVRVGHTTM